jgi:hypothetical protein
MSHIVYSSNVNPNVQPCACFKTQDGAGITYLKPSTAMIQAFARHMGWDIVTVEYSNKTYRITEF